MGCRMTTLAEDRASHARHDVSPWVSVGTLDSVVEKLRGYGFEVSTTSLCYAKRNGTYFVVGRQPIALARLLLAVELGKQLTE